MAKNDLDAAKLTDDTPANRALNMAKGYAAACMRCGGWTPNGGMGHVKTCLCNCNGKG